jgi:hypothetical protein
MYKKQSGSSGARLTKAATQVGYCRRNEYWREFFLPLSTKKMAKIEKIDGGIDVWDEVEQTVVS